MKITCLKYILFIFPLFIYKAEGKCDPITAAVSLASTKLGFHRELHYTIDLTDRSGHDLWNTGACRLSLRQVLPAGAYVSADQLKDLKRLRKLHASPEGDVDIEKPKHLSQPIVVWVHVPLDSAHITATLPVHLRYHQARPRGGYETIKIKHPWVLLRCPTSLSKMCTPEKTYTAPCTEFSPRDCTWQNLSTTQLSRPLNLSVPVGNLDDFSIVAPITMIVCFGGCFLILIMAGKTDISLKSIEKKRK